MIRMLIDPKLYNHDQSWYYETLWELTKGNVLHKVKVEIRRNAYNFQSWGRAYFFSLASMQWNTVAETAGPELKCLDLCYAMNDKLKAIKDHLPALQKDTFKLLYEAGQLLDIEVSEADFRQPKELKHA